MMKRWLAAVLALAMVVGTMTGCGGGNSDNSKKSETSSAVETDTQKIEKLADGGGKVLNIYIWNTEFRKRFEKYYPKYKNGAVDDVKVNFILNTNEGGKYQNKLDEALTRQDSAPDEKADIFLCEMDFVNKYTNTELAVPMEALGVTESDLAQMYDYTKQACTDINGVLRGISWQGCPGGFVYRRSYAKEIFGTDDPEKIQAKIADWDKFEAAAGTVKEKSKGKITMLAGYDDTLYVYANNAGMKFVSDDNKLQLDDFIDVWIDQTKKFTEKGYNRKASLRTDDWIAGMGRDGNVFGYFMSAEDIRMFLTNDAASGNGISATAAGGGGHGDWAICTGPQSFGKGGSFICGAAGTDNAALVGDIIKELCCNKDIMYSIGRDTHEFMNNREVNEKIGADNVNSDTFGGQSPVKVLSGIADMIDCSNLSPYDGGCIENLMKAMKEYYDGKVEKDTAIENWKEMTIKQYPGLSR